jgi:hypothetical protein
MVVGIVMGDERYGSCPDHCYRGRYLFLGALAVHGNRSQGVRDERWRR